MKYLCLIYDDEKKMAEHVEGRGDAFMGEYFAFTEDIKKSGHYVAGEALQPVHTATTVRIRNGKMSTTDGPFAETKEQLGGFYLIEAQGPERGACRSRAHSVGPHRQRRGAAGGGLQPAVQSVQRSVTSADERARQAVDAVYRAESRRVLATLIRLLGDFDRAEEALHDAFAAADRAVAATACPPTRAPGWSRPGRFKAIDAMRRRARLDASLGGAGRRARAPAQALGRRPTTTGGRGRSAAADLHLLPSGAAAGRADRADAARGVRAHHRRDRARVPDHRRPRSRSASCAPRRRFATPRIPYQVPSPRRAARAARHRAARRLPGVQRGLLGVVRRRR